MSFLSPRPRYQLLIKRRDLQDVLPVNCLCRLTFYRVQQIKDPTTPEAGVRFTVVCNLLPRNLYTVGDRVAYIFIFALKGLQRPIKFNIIGSEYQHQLARLV